MKKYLLGLLLIPFGLVAFSNAETVNVSCPFQSECSPYEINISPDNCVDGVSQLTLINISCVQNENSEVEDLPPDCGLNFYSEDGSWYNIAYEDGEVVDNSCYLESSNTLFTINSVDTEKDISVSLNLLSSNSGGGDGGDDNTGGDSGESGELIGQLTPVINGLSSAMSEFIPYVVYIGLGILGVIIGFVAIKWLINWVKGKSLGTFSSRRRK